MIIKKKSYNLYLVSLGGNAKNSHVELHDVRWVVGRTIQETFETLRLEWFGDLKGLHIDSYLSVKYIDGYKITLYESNSNSKISRKELSSSPKLWFVNLGAYRQDSFNELHSSHLVVAPSFAEAKRLAKLKWNKNYLKNHIDNIISCNHRKKVECLFEIDSIMNWRVNLEIDNKNRNQMLIPDWFGYMLIDNPNQY